MSRQLKMEIAMKAICAAVFALSLTGCVSTYSNIRRFDQVPQLGMNEIDLVQAYGAPDYSTSIEDQKVYVYKVRDSKFIVLMGQYSGYDMVITTKGGAVKDIRRLARGQGMTLFYAAPWMGHD